MALIPVQYNMSREFNFIYIAPPRTATRTIAGFFKENYPMMRQEGRQRLPSYSHEFNIPVDLLKSCTIICSIRNPFSRIASLYSHHSGITKWRGTPFPGQVPNLYSFSLWKFIKPIFEHVDDFIHLETLDEDIRKLPFVQDSKLALPNKFASNHPGQGWKKYYEDNPEAESLVLKLLGTDEFTKLGYSMRVQDA